jgi:hypothetical protein
LKSVFFILLLLAPPPETFRAQPSPAALSLIQANSKARVPPKTGSTEDRCSARQFTPNYAGEVGIFQSARWERFPLAIWIDSSTVENSEEMSELQAGLSKWSDATGGVLGVTFVEKLDSAQILINMVDKLPGANGRTRFVFTEHGVARLASIEIVHAHWAAAAPAVQIKSRTVQQDAAHEMGHALGIVGHTTQPETIMFRIPMTDAPSPLDVNTIKTKYCELF